jgi:tRNA-2-methylthio-N6-dimethylallyladenosine synthase
MVADIKGIERIRFATSHPKDLSDSLVKCFAGIDKLCTHFHIPVQSGSDNILKKMNRRYTREHYLERIEALRNVCPDIELSTDIIVGFPGETDSDFEKTMSLINEVEYDSVFAFAYSDRPGTRAASFENKVDLQVKKERLNTLLERQNFITKKKNSEFEGKKIDILVETADIKTDKNNIRTAVVNGRSFGNRIVHINEDFSEYQRLESFCGEIKKVKIVRALGHSLKGEFV